MDKIEKNRNLRPFEKRLPCTRVLLLKLLSLIVLLIYTYVCFILVQLALFNIILIGIMLIYFGKVATVMQAYGIKQEEKYKTSAFKKFID